MKLPSSLTMHLFKYWEVPSLHDIFIEAKHVSRAENLNCSLLTLILKIQYMYLFKIKNFKILLMHT